MKIVTWNCNGAFRNKFQLFDFFNPDLLIIQECENPEISDGVYKDWAKNYIWIGENKNRGMAIFAKEQIKLNKLNWSDESLKLFLPCRVMDNFNILAVWTKKSDSGNYDYIGQFWKYLQINETHIKTDYILICGDFNSNVIWDKSGREWNHSEVVKKLNSIQIESIYHKITNENQGKESAPTLYMQRNLDKPYHIDYIFSSINLFNKDSFLEVGKSEIWLKYSDHMPIFFETDKI